MNVEIKLIILHLDLMEGSSGVLLEDSSIISHTLSDNDIDRALRDILLEYLELHPEWVKFNLIDTLPTNSHISIVYSCLVPSLIKNKKGQWHTLGEINDKEIKRLVFQASQRIT